MKDSNERSIEIVMACRKLYRTMSYQEISLKEISCEISISRPSIYNYFVSKEEIFLEILREEYEAWSRSLLEILHGNEKMTKDEFAAALAHSTEGRETLFRIQCMNLYDIEEHSRIERLTEYKKVIRKVMEILNACLVKFFPSMTEEERIGFLYMLLPFMYGIYPYVYPTERQKEAMQRAGIPCRGVTAAQLVYACVRKLLG